MLLLDQGLFEHFGDLSLGDKSFGFQIVSLLCFQSFLDGFIELLDFLNLLHVLLVDDLDDFEGSMRFAKYSELSLFARLALLFLQLDAIVGSFGAFHVKVNLAILFAALHTGTNVVPFATTNKAKLFKPREVHFVYRHRLLGSHFEFLHPHRAAVVHPMIQSFSLRSVFKQLLVSLQEVAIVFRDPLVLNFMAVEVQYDILLSFNNLHTV